MGPGSSNLTHDGCHDASMSCSSRCMLHTSMISQEGSCLPAGVHTGGAVPHMPVNVRSMERCRNLPAVPFMEVGEELGPRARVKPERGHHPPHLDIFL